VISVVWFLQEIFFPSTFMSRMILALLQAFSQCITLNFPWESLKLPTCFIPIPKARIWVCIFYNFTAWYLHKGTNVCSKPEIENCVHLYLCLCACSSVTQKSLILLTATILMLLNATESLCLMPETWKGKLVSLLVVWNFSSMNIRHVAWHMVSSN